MEGFKIITNHKNLEYFIITRKLIERQMRWLIILSRFNFKLSYRPGIYRLAPNTLSRREQDVLIGEEDERLLYRER